MCKRKPCKKRMASCPFMTLCLLSLAHATAGLRSPGQLMTFALPGDDVTLPCGIPSIKSCSSISWSRAERFYTVSEVVKAGQVTPPTIPRLSLLKDCSLNIRRLMLDDARVYWCDSGALNSSVSLHILELAESSPSSDETMELHCYLNTYEGYRACNNRSMHIKWSTEENAPLNGKRFHVENISECFSKLVIGKKPTDHHRKWKCSLLQNDAVKATVSYTTTVKDGVEEVFTAVGETVSLSCHNASLVGVAGAVQWALDRRMLRDEVPLFKGETGTLSPLVIGRVSAEHAGDYQCAESTAQQTVLNQIRLHTVDITSESGGGNLTLTCVLTCSRQCDKDLSLTWSRSVDGSWQSGLMTDKETLRSRLVFPAPAVVPDELACLVLREGSVVASKKWSTINSLQTPAWLALPLAVVICFVAGGLYMKQKPSEEGGSNEQSGFRMNNIYEVVPDADNEALQPRRQCNQEAANSDSFYDLLQAFN